jgi:hypothetical protein
MTTLPGHKTVSVWFKTVSVWFKTVSVWFKTVSVWFKTVSVWLSMAVLVAMMSSCAITRVDPSERIVGNWRSEVGGFPVTVRYTESTVQVGDSAPVGYSLTGNTLKITGGDSLVRIVSFPARDEMVQQDPLTGTGQTYTRVDLD